MLGILPEDDFVTHAVKKWRTISGEAFLCLFCALALLLLNPKHARSMLFAASMGNLWRNIRN